MFVIVSYEDLTATPAELTSTPIHNMYIYLGISILSLA